MKVTVHTDGSCWPNPGPGAWAAVLEIDGVKREMFGVSSEPTTNNRMEMTAAIKALEFLAEPSSVTIVTDSEYLQKGASDWMWRWHRKGWKCKNPDLWKRIWELCAKHNVLWEWTRGHADNQLNNHCDALAEAARKQL